MTNNSKDINDLLYLDFEKRNDHSTLLSSHIEQSRMKAAYERRAQHLLPPISSDQEQNRAGCSPRSSKSPLSDSKLWSHYHRGCFTQNDGPVDVLEAKRERKHKRLNKTKKTNKMEDVKWISTYLDRNKHFLEKYVLENVTAGELEEWLIKKKTSSNTLAVVERKHKYHSREEDQETKSKTDIILDIIKKLDGANELRVSWEISKLICSSVGCDAYRVYKLYPDHTSYVQYFATDTTKDITFPTRMLKAHLTDIPLVLEAARVRTSLNLSKKHIPKSFPKNTSSLFKTFKNEHMEGNYVMYLPLLNDNGKTVYVIEMWRVEEEFDDTDEKICSNLITWGSLVLHYCNLYLDKKKERSMSDFLLDVVKAIFEEMISLDQLIKRILEFAQKLVNADRSSLFLVDYRNFELVSTVFDLKFEPGQGGDMEKKEIRMPINRGIAGHVALSGATMNIPDAYSDYRFNREVDEVTGYKTVSILCMPVKVQGKVIGVVQMVNKRNRDHFDHEDEVAFEMFSTFFGLALHHAKLYDTIMRNEQKYRVALEVLSYHNTCREPEVEEILKTKDTYIETINDFYINPYQFDDFQKCKAVINMFDDLFDLSQFDVMTLTRFILTVKKNYRLVPYHNFDHGWSVAQAMYVIIKNDKQKRFDYKMRLALFVACLCHDLDHRGYTNKYMNEIASPLAVMYTTSPLEHHHFNITVNILQQDGHNIFSHFSSEDYKDILRYIRHCILATDLAAFFPNLTKLNDMFKIGSPKHKFNWTNPNHRDLAMAISMTSADLSAAAKPWEIQIKTVRVIFEEFYDQGDKERAAGKVPIPMMDRSKPEEQPSSQVGFLRQICIPCYTMLYKILPKTKPMYKMVLKNLNSWKAKVIPANQDTENELLNDDISDITTESDLENDKSDTEWTQNSSNAEYKLNTNLKTRISDDSSYKIQFHANDSIEELDKLSNKIESEWKYIKSDTVSWKEEHSLDENLKYEIWKDIRNTWVDEEDVVTSTNRALKIRSTSKNNN